MKIENWSIGTKDEDAKWRAPEQLTFSLQGKVYGHSRFKDGEKICTSRILTIDWEAGIAKTSSGSEYKLGAVDEEYLEWLRKNHNSIKWSLIENVEKFSQEFNK